ncbi:hypothetical protein F4604DRAFT_1980636 [Suillus subluteus]|nr:hypothetical protein F4604DRAFT_1980636 [Suillus subluteus]
MAVTYGHTDLGAQDPFLACAQELLDIARHLLSPERAAMFAAFPFFKRLPVWCFHGAYALMGCSRELCHQLLDEPFNEVKAQMANGTTSQSLVADFLSQADNDADKDMMKAVALMGCIGGIDTSTSTLQVFLMAMLLYPDVQARARGSVMCLDVCANIIFSCSLTRAGALDDILMRLSGHWFAENSLWNDHDSIDCASIYATPHMTDADTCLIRNIHVQQVYLHDHFRFQANLQLIPPAPYWPSPNIHCRPRLH